jgi:serine/threonine-protein kinase
LTDRVDEVCDRFETAWLAGARPRIEDYVPTAAAPERESYLRELLILELAYRRRDGEEPNFAEYSARFPEHRAAVAARFSVTSDGGEERVATQGDRPAATFGVSRAAGPARLTLEVMEGPHKGRIFSFQEHDSFIVGRSAQAHFQLPKKDSHFSRIHFLIEFNPPHCRLMDLHSTNGTIVNGKKVARADLNEGDLIQGGTTTIRLRIDLAVDREPALAETVTYKGARTADVAPVLIPPVQDVTDARLTDRPGPAVVSGVQAEVGSSPSSCPACGATIRGLGEGPPSGEPCSGQGTLCAACQQAIRSQPQPIAGYEVIRELGRGGMGIVALARRTSDGSLIALKTVIPDVAATPEDIAKFLREARILSELDHPHIVRCSDVGDATDCVYFAMD